MVQLSEEAYRILRAKKRRGESFSEVVVRLAGKGASLRDLAGLRSESEIRRHERDLREIDELDRPE